MVNGPVLSRREPRMTILSDHAIGSSADFPDLLSLESRLAVVLDILRHHNTRCPITVAIYGDWGTGKTSAMRWLESQLRDWNKLDSKDRKHHPCVYPVWFDPWRFQTREEVWRGIIAEVILALFAVETLTRENFVPQMIEAAKKFGSFLGKGFLHALAGMDVKIKAGAPGSGAEIGIKGEMFRDIYDEFDRAIRPEKAYLNQFEETLKSWIQSSIKGDREQKFRARVALFIDDLDRCSPEVTLEVLEAIKLYLNIEPLVFIVGLDRSVVDAIVRKHYEDKGLPPRKSEQYLDKIFQVEIQISPSEQQMEEFLTRQIVALNDATGKYWSTMLEPAAHKQVVEKVIKSLAKENPREIKRLLNSALLRGRAAADNPSLSGPPQELIFAQGVQFFLIQRILRNRLSNATRLLLEKSSLQWFESFSVFIKDHPDYVPRRRKRDATATEELDGKYEELERTRPNDDDGKQVDLILLDDPSLRDLLNIPFSMVVAQSAPVVEPAKPPERAESSTQFTVAGQSSDMLARLPSVIRNRVAKSLDKRVDQITQVDLLDVYDLDLSDSRVDVTDLEYLTRLPSLQTLSLPRSNVTDADLAHVAKLGGLRRLRLGETNVSDEGLERVAELGSLQTLDLPETRITDVGLEILAKLRSLQTLDLRGTKISDPALEHLAKLNSLENLNLRDTGITDVGLEHLAKARSLHVLNLRHSEVTDAGLGHLANLRSLQDLDLSETKITDAGLEHLAKLNSLQSLNLDETQITNVGLRRLAKLSSLLRLRLGTTKISDAGLEHLASLKSLLGVRLQATNITDAGLKHLAKLSSLQDLNLKETKVTAEGVNQLRGRLPYLARRFANRRVDCVNLRSAWQSPV
jgi:Leucine-rich repeat (LRR) protein